ncbi:MAG: PorV/PorQ family protein [candidate division WOR-3 bacterium]|nr:PorV/PorQ family protein [candidate division WOR-3 bacterium]MCX7948159.1 PorV/PorQ family protein [candidate division WOR-3 bacterium]MDW8151032.1 PorV/PorQ family protein [candidate division WOR-3 bacterium]
MRKIVFLFLLPLPLFAQSSKAGQAGAKFLSLPYNVRGESMGGSYVNISDASSIFTNPAGVSNINRRSVYILSGYYWGILQFGASYIIPTKRGNVGFFIGGVNISGFEAYSVDLNGNIIYEGSFSYLGSQIGANFSRYLTDKFSIGINGKFIYEGFGGYSNAYSLALDVGTYYMTGFRDFVLGASIRHFGFDLKPSGEYTKYVYEASLDSSKQSYSAYKLPAIFSFGISGSILRSAYGKLSFALQIDHPVDNLENYNIGLEYSLIDILFIRTGYKIYQNVDEAVAGANGITFGLGVRYGRLGVDYGFYNKGILPPINQVALYYSF